MIRGQRVFLRILRLRHALFFIFVFDDYSLIKSEIEPDHGYRSDAIKSNDIEFLICHCEIRKVGTSSTGTYILFQPESNLSLQTVGTLSVFQNRLKRGALFLG